MEKKYKIGMDVAIAVTALGLFANLIGIVFVHTSGLMQIIDTLLFVLVGYYAVWGYKKPHGNMLRYIMLIFAFSHLSVFFSSYNIGSIMFVVRVIIMCLITYVAGRLNKIQKNKYIMVLILLLYLYTSIKYVIIVSGVSSTVIADNLKLVVYAMSFSRTFLWTAICSAYFTRYLQHKEAGLED